MIIFKYGMSNVTEAFFVDVSSYILPFNRMLKNDGYFPRDYWLP